MAAAAEAAGTRLYRVLGPVEARLDNRVLPVARGKQTVLLAALLARPDRVVPVETLVDSLWGQRPPSGASGTLRALVSKLRRGLADHQVHGEADELLVAAAGGYRLRLHAGDRWDRVQEVLDARRFTSLLQQARRTRLSGETAEAVQAYQEALGLWRGAAFAGATGSAGPGGLVTAEARRLDTERIVATEEWLAAELDLGQHARVLGELEALVATEPLRESLYALFMIALYRAGRQPDALATYRRLRALLDEELGVEPSTDVRTLHERLLLQDPTLDRPLLQVSPDLSVICRIAPAADDVFPRRNLPVMTDRLVGRDAILAQTDQLLRVARVVTLTGTAGVGKTRLAVHTATRAVRAAPRNAEHARSRFSDGAWLVELAGVSDGNGVVDVVSRVLAVQEPQGLTVLEGLVEYLRPKRLLLVLDNCEHVVDAAAELVAAVTAGCPGAVVLVTSREPLRVGGEHVRPVPPLAVPPPSCVDVEEVRRAAAVALFVPRAQAAAPDFALTDRNAGQVAEICRRLDGLPLAIELAATHMRSMTPAELLDRLEQRFRLLRSGQRTAMPRHRTLQAAIDWSYALLDQDERRVFDSMSVFAGGFELKAAERVVTGRQERGSGRRDRRASEETAVATLLGGLVDKSMVVAEPSDVSTRYTLLQTLRAYGAERLAARREEHAARRTHATYFAAVVEGAAGHLAGSESARHAEAIARDMNDVYAAHVWALGHDIGVAIELVAGLFRYVEHRTPPDVPVWAGRTVEVVETTHVGRHPLLPTVYAVAARGAARCGDLDRAKVLAQRGVAAGGVDNAARRHPLYALAVVALFEGRLNDAKRLTVEVERLALAAEDAWFAVRAQTIRGLAQVYAGNRAAALTVADEARARADRSGDSAAIGWSRYLTGEVLLETDPDQSAMLLEEALAAARATDDRYLAGVASVSATSVRARHGDPGQAASLFRDVIDQWRAAGNWTQQWTTVRNIVELLVRVGADEPAAVLLGALDGSATAPPAFGAGATRLVAVRRDVAEHLSPERIANATGRGAAMGDDQALRFARGALDLVMQGAALVP